MLPSLEYNFRRVSHGMSCINKRRNSGATYLNSWVNAFFTGIMQSGARVVIVPLCKKKKKKKKTRVLLQFISARGTRLNTSHFSMGAGG